uniref:DUF4283 domain-containing protein n=1 Tax=Nelumbo nucifera TaxID=4432 RepID=A0A822XMS2_NELNU|nr:TPA_asm: hypothetical protein HUJ06_024367 [Nelumbo nucifera]
MAYQKGKGKVWEDQDNAVNIHLAQMLTKKTVVKGMHMKLPMEKCPEVDDVLKHLVKGRIFPHIQVTKESFKKHVKAIWSILHEVNINFIEGGQMEIFMEDVNERQRVLNGGPWFFKASWILVALWTNSKDGTIEKLHH